MFKPQRPLWWLRCSPLSHRARRGSAVPEGSASRCVAVRCGARGVLAPCCCPAAPPGGTRPTVVTVAPLWGERGGCGRCSSGRLALLTRVTVWRFCHLVSVDARLARWKKGLSVPAVCYGAAPTWKLLECCRSVRGPQPRCSRSCPWSAVGSERRAVRRPSASGQERVLEGSAAPKPPNPVCTPVKLEKGSRGSSWGVMKQEGVSGVCSHCQGTHQGQHPAQHSVLHCTRHRAAPTRPELQCGHGKTEPQGSATLQGGFHQLFKVSNLSSKVSWCSLPHPDPLCWSQKSEGELELKSRMGKRGFLSHAFLCR